MPGHDNTGEWAYRYAFNFYLLLAEFAVSDDLLDLLLHLFRYVVLCTWQESEKPFGCLMEFVRMGKGRVRI